MAKKVITTTEELVLGKPNYSQYVRSDLKEEITKYYLGRKSSNIGCLCGHMRKDGSGLLDMPYSFFRDDVASLQYMGVTNCFIQGDGRPEIQPWEGVTLTHQEIEQIHNDVREVYERNKEYFDHEWGFVKWLHIHIYDLDGKTPEEAIQILTDAGY